MMESNPKYVGLVRDAGNKILSENARLREALTTIEFDAGGYCNSCMGLQRHEDDCLVGQALGRGCD